MEGVFGLTAVLGRLGERIDDIEKFDDAAGQPWVRMIGRACS